MDFPHIYKVACHTDNVGPGSTFVVIKGMKLDGADYISLALLKGATTVVVEQGMIIDDSLKKLIASYNAELIMVPSARLALAQLSAQAYGYPAQSLTLIGITGTKGKSTTAFLAEHLLKTAGYKTALVSTIENRILNQRFEAPLTTPQPDYLHVFFDLCRSNGVQYVVMEVAAQALSLHRTATLLFDTSVFTNFSLEHSEFYATQNDYFAAKCSLFNQTSPQGCIVINADDSQVLSYGQKFERSRNVQKVSLYDRGTIQANILSGDLSALTLEVTFKTAKHHFLCPGLLGEFSAYNVLCALAIAEKYGVSAQTMTQALATFGGVPGRVQHFPLPNGAVACIDNAHTPSSFEAFLSAVRPLTPHLIAVFGAGGDRDHYKRPQMGALAVRYADTVILTTDNPRSEDPAAIIEAIKMGIDEMLMPKVLCIVDREKAIRKAYELSKPGTLIALLGKGPVEYQHIHDTKIPFSEAAILRSL